MIGEDGKETERKPLTSEEEALRLVEQSYIAEQIRAERARMLNEGGDNDDE